MLTSLLAVAVPSLLAGTRADYGGQHDRAPAPVEVGIQVSTTRFLAHNFSDRPQLLVLSSPRTRVLHVLAPGTEIDCDFPLYTLDDMQLEVATLETDGWNSSGSFDLAELTTSETLWIQGDLAHSAWIGGAGQVSLAHSNQSALPPWMLRNSPSPRGVGNTPHFPVHVPTIIPSNRPRRDSPPQLGRKPLPTV
jgi:hypothetical protein